jgi:hypothetical protein
MALATELETYLRRLSKDVRPERLIAAPPEDGSHEGEEILLPDLQSWIFVRERSKKA